MQIYDKNFTAGLQPAGGLIIPMPPSRNVGVLMRREWKGDTSKGNRREERGDGKEGNGGENPPNSDEENEDCA